MLWKNTKPLTYFGAAILVLSVGWMGNSCSAGAIGMEVLLSALTEEPEAEIVSGDKRFTDFTYSATGDMPGAGGINVIPIQDGLGNFGIRFQGAFIDLPSSQGGSDALITYKVWVDDPMYRISDAHLSGNPNLLGETGSVSVTETFLPLGGNGEYTMQIFDDENKDVPQQMDWVDFDEPQPIKMLMVQKDILAIATEGSQSATLSFVDQTFSQEIIPEPTTLLLSVVGMVGLAGVLRRRDVKNRA